MYRDEEVRMVVEDLVRILHQQATDLETLTDHLAQFVGRLPDAPELAIVRSELAGLHVRAKKLVSDARTES